MKKLEYTVQFVTPAFLGNADQVAQWRTPPFKTLLRQWWRITKARELNYSVNSLKHQEGEVFGTAAEDSGTRSRVRLGLSKWAAGTRTRWEADPKITHPEVTDKNTGRPKNIGSHLYLGYGPLNTVNGATGLKKNAAIQENDQAGFSLIVPDELENDFHDVIQLAHWFGTLGGRSRNGWGSATFAAGNTVQPFEKITGSSLVQRLSSPLQDCLTREWPHALGSDNRGWLIWRASTPAATWLDAMRELARIKIAFRTHLHFTAGRNGPLEPRHLLAYPVTNHSNMQWEPNARLPNQLRFKVHKTSDGKYLPTAFHFPVKTPVAVGPSLSVQQQITTWQQVHRKMDELMTRVVA